MEVAELEEALKVFESSISRTKWRLKASSKRRLETDVLALCTGMRPAIMVDYGGKMPELKDQLCAFLKLSQRESSIFEHLRVMVIEDMIYLIHVRSLAKLVKSTLNLETDLLFVDLEQDPPKMGAQVQESLIAMQLTSVLKLFSLVFPASAMNDNSLQFHRTDSAANSESSVGGFTTQCAEFIDLSSCMQDTMVTVPTLNGWLLGYPVVYLFSKEHIADAIYNLSITSLHLFKILVCRNDTSNKGSPQQELMSFSVPYDLSVDGANEPWAKAFMVSMQGRWERCKQIWGSLKMEVSGCYPQAIVL